MLGRRDRLRRLLPPVVVASLPSELATDLLQSSLILSDSGSWKRTVGSWALGRYADTGL